MKKNKILIFSDNHGKKERMNKIIQKYNSEVSLILHAGDILLTKDNFESKINYVVKGNNDYEDYEYEYKINFLNKLILLTHGNLYFGFGGYKPNYKKLISFMENEKIDIFVHGHLHIPYSRFEKNKLFVCPGSIDYPRSIEGASFCILEVKEHEYKVEFYKSNNFKLIKRMNYFW